MPLHVAFVDLTKQGSNRCHSTWLLWISQNKGATDATPRGLCGSHKTREQQMPLHVAFVDLTKTFDYVNREALFTFLKKVGCPPILLDLIKSFHEHMQGTAQVDGMVSEPFPIVNGVKQGCVLAPTLFGIYFSVILREAMQNANLTNPGVGLRTRFNANLRTILGVKWQDKITKLPNYVWGVNGRQTTSWPTQIEKHTRFTRRSNVRIVMLAINQYDAANKSIVSRDRSWPL